MQRKPLISHASWCHSLVKRCGNPYVFLLECAVLVGCHYMSYFSLDCNLLFFFGETKQLGTGEDDEVTDQGLDLTFADL